MQLPTAFKKAALHLLSLTDSNQLPPPPVYPAVEVRLINWNNATDDKVILRQNLCENETSKTEETADITLDKGTTNLEKRMVLAGSSPIYKKRNSYFVKQNRTAPGLFTMEILWYPKRYESGAKHFESRVTVNLLWIDGTQNCQRQEEGIIWNQTMPPESMVIGIDGTIAEQFNQSGITVKILAQIPVTLKRQALIAVAQAIDDKKISLKKAKNKLPIEVYIELEKHLKNLKNV